MRPLTAIDAAYESVSSGSPIEGQAVLEAAGKSGDTAALVELANWFLRGDIISRDVPAARALLRQAAALDNAEAALTEAALAANGSGGSTDWRGAVALLRQASATNQVAAAQLATLEKMAFDADGMPRVVPKLQQISSRPAVWRAAGLLTHEECQQVALAAADILEPATVIDPATGRNIVNPVRTSDTALIGPTRENLVIRALNQRLAALTGTGVEQGEALTVLRYSPGQLFRPHLDALPRTSNQRIKTVLIYLNDGFEGGATTFPHVTLRVTPRAGDALIFDNVDSHGAIDASALHEGETVVRGTKWLATRWIRARAFSPWTGPEMA